MQAAPSINQIKSLIVSSSSSVSVLLAGLSTRGAPGPDICKLQGEVRCLFHDDAFRQRIGYNGYRADL